MKATELSPIKRARKFLDKESNARGRGIKFTLSLTQWDDLIANNPVCYYSGQPFANMDDITVERVDSRKGYEAGNVVLCNSRTNCVKEHLDQFEKVEDLPVATLIKMMRKSLYRLEKRQREIDKLQSKRQVNPMDYVKTAMSKAKR